ncbi:MAG: FkbM family methyltransferase [Acidobacteriia bacterium]|nr:FkbM family methyltransferase [Terriglobia bacterium]
MIAVGSRGRDGNLENSAGAARKYLNMATIENSESVTDMDLFSDDRHFLARLKATGYEPRVIYDVGASTGIWSEVASTVFPDAKFHLFEPLAELYKNDLQSRMKRLPNLALHAVALGDANGTAPMFVARDKYGSSLNDRGEVAEVLRATPVPVHRLDDYARQWHLPPPQVVKIDCQGAEALIMAGAEEALQSAEVLLLETWFQRGYGPKTPLICEIVEFLRIRRFSLVDLGEHFYDQDHRLYSVDAFFLAESLLTEIRLPPECG